MVSMHPSRDFSYDIPNFPSSELVQKAYLHLTKHPYLSGVQLCFNLARRSHSLDLKDLKIAFGHAPKSTSCGQLSPTEPASAPSDVALTNVTIYYECLYSAEFTSSQTTTANTIPLSSPRQPRTSPTRTAVLPWLFAQDRCAEANLQKFHPPFR
jgi:hypothetical protein